MSDSKPISTISDAASRSTLSSGDTVDHADHNTTRTDRAGRIDDLNDVVADLENGYAGTSVPTDKPEGKRFVETTNDPAEEYYYGDSSSNLAVSGLAAIERGKGLIHNFGFTATIDSPAAGDITLTFTQGDNSTACTAKDRGVFSFWGTKRGLYLTATATLKLDSTDDFGFTDRVANTEATLFIYAINRGGTLAFGVGPRGDFTRASADFTTVEGECVNRDHVFCTAAITANDPCYVVGYFKATFDTTANDWSAVTAESDVVGLVPAPNPDSITKAWAFFNGSGGIASVVSFNVITIARGALGTFTVTLDTDMDSASYAPTITPGLGDLGTLLIYRTSTFAAGSLIFNLGRYDTGAADDSNQIAVTFTGRQ